MIINQARILQWNSAAIKRNDLLTVPLIVPKPPLMRDGKPVNGVNFPVKQQGYRFPNPAFIPYALPTSPMPMVSSVNTPSYINQSSGTGQIGPTKMAQYLQGYLGKG